MKTYLNDDVFLKKGYTISADKNLLQFDSIFEFLINESYWSQNLTTERLQRAINGSLCFGIYYQQQQVGFARVVTDEATFAYLCDVFVVTGHRGTGLSKWLVQTIQQHPGLSDVRRWLLATADAHGLYAQMGFAPLARPERWMEIFNPYPVTEQE